jgi:hypothetical protein
MPVTVSYPGVYIEEIPSGVRTVTGVATSLTAFIGRAKRGPIDSDETSPVTINSFADFERIFGGLWAESALGFAAHDFYRNGGSQALIVRLYHPKTGTKAKAILNAKTLTLEAAYPGAWANKLRARIDHDTRPLDNGSPDPDTFNLFIRDGETGTVEVFRNVSVKPDHLRRVDKILENESRLVRTAASLPGTRPDAHQDPEPDDKVVSGNEASDGDPLQKDDFTGPDKHDNKQGLYALKKADLFNLLCIPGYKDTGSGLDVEPDLVTSAAGYCEERRAMLLVDPPSSWKDKKQAKDNIGNIGTASKNAALFFPRLRQPNPEHGDQIEDFVPCGAVAGVFARTDTQRGVWKAPAGLEATLVGVPELSVPLNDLENGELNPLGVNCLRTMPAAGRVVWGARTLQGDDRLASEWKYSRPPAGTFY